MKTNLTRITFASLFLLTVAGLIVWMKPQTSPVTTTAARAVAIETKAARPVPPDAALVDLKELPPSPAILWDRPVKDETCAAFKSWTQRFQSAPAAEKPALENEGRALAEQRRAILKSLIKHAPETALELGVPESVRRAMPPSVAALLEERIDARGDLLVTAFAPPVDKSLPGTSPAVRYRAVIGGEKLRAYVYGRRGDQPTRYGIPLHGIALDGMMAVNEWPARVLEPVEKEEARNLLAAEPVCPTSGVPTAQLETEIALTNGGTSAFYCEPAHALSDLRRAAAAESLLPPGLGRSKTTYTLASGGNGIAVPNAEGVKDAAWTTGAKRVGIVPLKFDGVNYHQRSYDDCSEILDRINDAWTAWSYGKCTVRPLNNTGSFITGLLNLDDAPGDYDGDDISDIWDEAIDWADSSGRDEDTYDILVVIAGPVGIEDPDDEDKTVTWSGKGRVGEGLTFLRVASVDDCVEVALHEMGHNLGLRHASNLFTNPKPISTIGGYTFYEYGEEYGDLFDSMGWGHREYNVHNKHSLHWLTGAEVPLVTGDGRFTIREHDAGDNGGVRGLEVPVVPGVAFGLADTLFVEYRIAHSNFATGAQIRLGRPMGSNTWLLDGTPETDNSGIADNFDGSWDSALPPGRTLSWTTEGSTVYVTTISTDPAAGKLVVQVNHGTGGNSAPAGTLTSSVPTAAAGQKVILTASVTDPNGDELAYSWSIPGLPQQPNARIVTVSFPAIGSYPVQCTASDMRGGTVTVTKTISVIVNQPPEISALRAAEPGLHCQRCDHAGGQHHGDGGILKYRIHHRAAECRAARRPLCARRGITRPRRQSRRRGCLIQLLTLAARRTQRECYPESNHAGGYDPRAGQLYGRGQRRRGRCHQV